MSSITTMATTITTPAATATTTTTTTRINNDNDNNNNNDNDDNHDVASTLASSKLARKKLRLLQVSGLHPGRGNEAWDGNKEPGS